TPKTLINSLHATARNFDTPSYWTLTLIRNFWKFAKNGRKKSSKSFSDLLLHVPLRCGGMDIQLK
ncbi:hypothetical protein, partial [Fusicatenibacter saccharivorans]|uniref:hypothetical protein n=1 Tax=Fusicatenibacter saccharivorans TaxID=1150298 RepID=UPI0034A3BDEE